MLDHSRLRTGFDLEILLGADYFLTVLGGAYDAGQIPSEIVTDDGTTIPVLRPTAVRILPDGESADIEVTVPVILVDQTDVILGMGVTVAADGITLDYRYLDDTTRGLIAFFGLITGQPDLLAQVEADLEENLNQEVPLDLVSGDVAEVQVKKVSAESDFQAAYGLYLNLDLKIAPQSGPPEADFTPRGNLDAAVSFLPAELAFAVGVGLPTFPRLANDLWHGLGEEQDDGSLDHPVKDGDDTVGVYKSIAITPALGSLRITVKSEIFIDLWPDAEVTAVFTFTPRVNAGVLRVDLELVEFDADTGLLGDFLSFLIGGVVGAIIGLFFGPVGLVIGASIGGVGGIATLEIGEAVAEGAFSDKVEEQADEAGVASMFSAFPVRKRLFSDTRDPFFTRHYEVVNLFDEANVDLLGMSFGGSAVMQAINEPVDTTIVDKTRGNSPAAWNGLEALTYRLDSLGDVSMPIAEVLRRIPLQQLQRVRLRPIQVRRRKTIVTDIQFDSGVDLHVAETVALHDRGALVVLGYQLIHPRDAKPYYRAWADQRLDNNFESLPDF